MPEDASYCHRCGTRLPAGATFCPKCGASVISGAAPTTGPQQPRRAMYGEKGEKHEKHEKNEKGEKGAGSSMLGASVGGSILIWLGVTFFLEQNGYLGSNIWWAYFVSGLGLILILRGAVLYSQGHRGLGSLIGGAVITFIGLSAIADSQLNLSTRFWPLFLVALGLFVVFAALASRRRVPAP
ncbi:MAG: zinc-ribbon domain-containing protein [Thaumarchaeota archaeon]|nr:zinc-ribbon domain-containing protein [Nitrososphaerota archaeon]